MTHTFRGLHSPACSRQSRKDVVMLTTRAVIPPRSRPLDSHNSLSLSFEGALPPCGGGTGRGYASHSEMPFGHSFASRSCHLVKCRALTLHLVHRVGDNPPP